MQQYNRKIIKYTIQFMHTCILKDEQVATYIAPEEREIKYIHLVDTMPLHSILWWIVGWGTRRVNRMDILSKGRNQFSLVYTWESWNQQWQG